MSDKLINDNIDVFISYSSKNEDIANQIEKSLNNRKVNCWKANLFTISGGEDFRTKIVSAIDQARIVLLVLSKESLESNWVNAELTTALIKNKKIYTIHTDDSNFGELIEFKLGCSQIVDGNQDLERAIESLVVNISNERNRMLKEEIEQMKNENKNINFYDLFSFLNITYILNIFLTLISNIFVSDYTFFEGALLFLLHSIISYLITALLKFIYSKILHNYAYVGCASAKYLLYKRKIIKSEKEIELLKEAAHKRYIPALKEMIRLYSEGKYLPNDEFAIEELKQILNETNNQIHKNQFIYSMIMWIFIVLYSISLFFSVMISFFG